MSVMSNLAIDLENMIEEGYSNSVIAEALGVSVDIVAQFRQEFDDIDNYDDSMDGDIESALASAGFGTDEDYGYHGEE
jgi:predicted transcriptional regulator